MAGEDENPNIPLPDEILIDLGAKAPISSPRSPPYGSKELYIPRKVNKKKAKLREKILIERQSSEASEDTGKQSMKKCDVPIRGASFGEKLGNVGLREKKYSDPSKGVQKKGLSKVLLPTYSDELESDKNHDEYLF
ncbi:hypothetical protein AB3S75_000278 [Citrus x aurantiifolia]